MGWNKNADANVSTITNTSTNGIGIGGDDLEHQSLWTIDSDSDNEYVDKDICQMQSLSVMLVPMVIRVSLWTVCWMILWNWSKDSLRMSVMCMFYFVNQLEPEPEPEPEKPDSELTNTCTITNGLETALMNQVTSGPSFEFMINCMEQRMTKECEMRMIKVVSETCEVVEGLTVRHVDFRVESMNMDMDMTSGIDCQMPSDWIGPDGITCQPVDCTPGHFYGVGERAVCG